ncbi:MAG: hypothetical protein EB060_04720 [Proteobacteria bacterium]|nr:hypothetical protein [Pseudomonadota bacterium]
MLSSLTRQYRGRTFRNLEYAMIESAKLAELTASQGNYGVAAFLIDENGEVAFAAVNTTVRGFTYKNGSEVTVTRPHTDGHAEKELVRQLLGELLVEPGKYDPSKMTLVCNLMCCPMCTDAVVKAGIGKVITAAPDPGVAIGALAYPEGSLLRQRADFIFSRAKTYVSDGMSESVFLDRDGEEIERARMLAKVRSNGVQQSGLYDGQYVSHEVLSQNYCAFHDSAAKVREYKQAQKALSNWNGKNALVEISRGKAPPGLAEFFYTTVGHHFSFEEIEGLNIATIKDSPEYLVSVLAGEAIDSAKKGNRAQASGVFTPDGNFLFVKGNRTDEKTLLHTSIERVLKVADILSSPTVFDHQRGMLVENRFREWFPTPDKLTYLSMKGPYIGAAARLAGMMVGDIRYLRHNHGDEDKGWDAPDYTLLPEFYRSSGKVQMQGGVIPGRGLDAAIKFCGTEQTNEIMNKLAQQFRVSGMYDQRHKMLEPVSSKVISRV